MASMGDRARALANLGLAVFPLYTVEGGRCSCRNATCSSPGKHPIGSLVPQGVLNATTDVQAIREWWAVYEDANIGVATGDASGAVVVDVDPRHGGDETLDRLEDRFGRLPESWAAWTGGGGMHFWFRLPPVDVRNSAGAVGPGIDVRGSGGYVVAPPSLHASGGRYGWVEAHRPIDLPLVDPPEWLLERMAPSSSVPASVEAIPTRIPEGMRNVVLTSAAGTMRRRGFCEEAIYAALAIENRKRCNPPLDERELRRIARSIERYPPERTVRWGSRAAS